MALIDILRLCAQESGHDLNNTDQKNDLISRVGQAAKELYESTDLVNCLREQVFCMGDASQTQLSLPWYVFQLRGVRGYETRQKITLLDMRPRYHSKSWNPQNMWEWRVKHYSPLERDIDNASQLTFNMQIAEAVDVNIWISGATPTATRVSEKVTIPAGSLSASSSNTYVSGNNYTPLEAIRKESLNNQDIQVVDASGNQLAIIPNSELESRYSIVHVRDLYCNLPQSFASTCSTCVEILFKVRFTPMRNDYDPFISGERYDKAIFYKFMEHWLTGQQGMEQRAIGMWQKCKELLNQIAWDAEAETSKPMDFGINRYHAPQDYFPWWSPWGGYNNWRYR